MRGLVVVAAAVVTEMEGIVHALPPTSHQPWHHPCLRPLTPIGPSASALQRTCLRSSSPSHDPGLLAFVSLMSATLTRVL